MIIIIQSKAFHLLQKEAIKREPRKLAAAVLKEGVLSLLKESEPLVGRGGGSRRFLVCQPVY